MTRSLVSETTAQGVPGPRSGVHVQALSKTFGNVRVLREVDLHLAAGAVHALIGENGSGKSTLIKCLSGFYTPDAGSSITLDGQQVTHAAAAERFAFVHQDLGLIPQLPVLDNIGLVQGFDVGRGWRIRWRLERARAARLLAAYGIDTDPATPVAALGAAERALLAILRAVESRESTPNLLVLDEPTAALPEAGRERVLQIVRDMALRGVAVLYVSHRLREVLSLAETVTVLRDGVRVASRPTAGLTESDLVEEMVGRQLATAQRRTTSIAATGSPVLQVRGLSGLGVKDVTFDVRPGEILGLTGLLGAGQNDVGKLVFGASKRRSGQVVVGGVTVRPNDPAAAIGAGIAFVPADRVHESTLAQMTVRENVTLVNLGSYARRTRLLRHAERTDTARLLAKYDVRPSDPEYRMRQLSGGNQQKVIVGKWLNTAPRVLIVDEPTQGVDVAARADIYRMLERAADAGTAVVLVDTDLDEVIRMSDRVLVLADGRLRGTVAGEQITRHRLIELMNAKDES